MTQKATVPTVTDESVANEFSNTLRVGIAEDIDFSDPVLGYSQPAAQLHYVTQARLLNYPDVAGPEGVRLVPEVAVDFPVVSDDGRTYLFTLHSGDSAYRFNTGEVVTAHHFAFALNRALRPELASPASSFIDGIVGARDVIEGRSQSAQGIQVVSDRELRIELEEAAPDFLHRVSMWFFGAIPLDTPIVEGGANVVPSAGPYYMAAREPGKSLELRRNPYYRHGRPNNVDGISYVIGVDFNETIGEIEAGRLDYVADGIAPHLEAYLGETYGLNKKQYFMRPSLQLDYLALNTSRPLFSDPRVRRAVSYAIDRPEILKARGAHAGVVTDHILPRGMPGFRDEPIYPHDGPDYERARAELPPDFEATEPARVYGWHQLAGPRINELIKENLGAIGIPVVIETYHYTELYQLAARRDEPFDIAVSGMTADYPDPFVFVNQLLDGGLIKREHNTNNCYFDDPEYNKRMRECARLTGEERYAAYGQLDLDIMRTAAPMLACDNNTKREFVSSRVLNAFQHGVYGLDFGALKLETAG